MRRLSKIPVPVMLAVCCLACVMSVCGADEGADRLAVLKQREAVFGQQIKNLEEEAGKLQQEYLDLQQAASYSNEQTRVIYNEVKQLEKQLVEKKKQLADALEKLPEYRDMEKRRNVVFMRLSKLREESLLLKQEIRALEAKAVAEKE